MFYENIIKNKDGVFFGYSGRGFRTIVRGFSSLM